MSKLRILRAIVVRCAVMAVALTLVGCTTDECDDTDSCPALAITPINHDFGELEVGVSSAPARFVVENSASRDFHDLEVRMGGAHAADFSFVSSTCSRPVFEPDETCDVEVVFTAGESGPKNASLEVFASDADRIGANLTGSGAEPPELAIRPSQHDFGATEPNTTSSVVEFTVTNTGSSETGSLSVGLLGAAPQHFELTTEDCSGARLAVEVSCKVSVRFAPDVSGTLDAVLRVAEDQENSEATARLSGTSVIGGG